MTASPTADEPWRSPTPIGVKASGLLLLAAGLALQVFFFRAYPQPILFGDPAEYAQLGHRLHHAAGRAVHHPGAAYAEIRGTLFMVGVSSVFALLEAARPGDWAFARMVMALFNTAAMLGVFFLARQLAGSQRAGLLGLGLAAFYPSFALQTGRLYPDPITGCFFVWSSYTFARAAVQRSPRTMAFSALLLSAGLFVRSQIIDFVLLFLLGILAVSLPLLRRDPARRSLVLVFALSLLPLTLCWFGIRTLVGHEVDPAVQGGNETFKPYYPYGFWQYLDTDGWIGPYRLKTEPYALELQRAAESDSALVRSFRAQLGFTVRYVLSRWRESVLLVWDNVYRLYDRPANDYKWDYPFPYSLQVPFQKGLLVLAVAGIAIWAAREPLLLGAFLMPVAIAVLHGLVFPWPRYNLPAMPILLGSAGAALDLLLCRAPRPRGLLLIAAGLGLLLLALALIGPLPEASRALRLLGWVSIAAAPLVLLDPPAWAGALAIAALAIPMGAHAARDRLWHETSFVLDEGHPGAEQEIRLSGEALSRLKTAPEAFVVLDLSVPEGDLEGVRLEVGGREAAPGALVGTLPRLPESTTTGGRGGRGYPQWWALPLDPQQLPGTPEEPFRVRLFRGRAPLTLKGDHFSLEQSLYEGPSFGDWPHAVDLKLEYDGDNRLGIDQRLASGGTESFRLSADGTRVPVRGVFRIRLVTLKGDVGRVEWDSAPLPKAPSSLVFRAFSGREARGLLSVSDRTAFAIPLGPQQAYQASSDGVRLCVRPAEGDKAGSAVYVLGGSLGRAGTTVHLSVRYLTGMSLEPIFFVPDRRPTAQELAPALEACSEKGTPVTGVARIERSKDEVYPDTFRSWIRVALGDAFPDPGGEGPFRWSVSEVF